MIELKHVSYAYADETTTFHLQLMMAKLPYVPECQAVASQLY